MKPNPKPADLVAFVDDLFGGPLQRIPVPPAYFNTTGLTGGELNQAQADAQFQEQAVLAIFRKHAHPLGASEVWQYGMRAQSCDWLLTSVRRAISNLERKGLVEKLDLKTEGAYGKPEHLHRIPVTRSQDHAQ